MESHAPPLPSLSFIKGNGSDNHAQTGSILEPSMCRRSSQSAFLQPSILIASSTDNYSRRSARNREQIKGKSDYECNAV